MIKNNSILLLVFLILQPACKNKNEKITFYNDKNGIRQVFSPDGNLIIEQQIIKGQANSYILNGYSKEFYNNKSIKSESYFRNGIIDSVSILYHPNGKISEWYYRNEGLLSGPQGGLDSFGNIRWVNFATRQDSAIFKITFDAKSNITSFSGFPLYVIEKPHAPRKGEVFSVANIVFQCKNIQAFLNVKLIDDKNNVLVNKDAKKYMYIRNNDICFFDYTFDKSGKYYYCAEIKLFDTLHKQLIQKTLVKDSIFVQ